MRGFSELKRDLLAECEDDYVGLWSVIGYVEDEAVREEAEIRRETLKLLQELLESGQIVSGEPDSNGVDFHIWPFPADVIIKHIKSQWKANSRRPGIGEIAWFTAPSKNMIHD